MENTLWKTLGMEDDVLAMLQPDSPNDTPSSNKILYSIAKRYCCRITQAESSPWPVEGLLEGLQLNCCLG